MTQTLPNNLNDFPLLNRLLQNKSEEFKAQVLDYVKLTNIQPDDPVVVFAILFGQLEILLKETPDTLERIFGECFFDLKQTLELAERGLIARQRKAIAEAALEVIKDARKEAQRELRKKDGFQPWLTIICASGCLAGLVGFGYFLGMVISPFMQGGYVESMKITAKQAALLQWAESPQGKKAKELMTLNEDYLKTCEKDAQRLGVTLTLNGVSQKSGFCLLRVKR